MNASRRQCRQSVLALVAAMIAINILVAPASADSAPDRCDAVTIPVLLDVIDPMSLHGTLCVPNSGPVPATVELLVHGGTYNSSYWDFGYQPDTYSYVRAATEGGYATLAVDRLGTGASSRPLSSLVTATADADTLHQVVEQLRDGQIGGTAFAKVVIVGHSLGSAMAVIEAGTFHDVDGVVLTGYTHQISTQAAVSVFTKYLYPAAFDPMFTGKGYDPGYWTTLPGERAAFFNLPGAENPAVAAYDELTKDVVNMTELPDDAALGFAGPTSLLIEVPVFIDNGTDDTLLCQGLLGTAATCTSAAQLKTDEQPYFSPITCLQTAVLSGAGHDINLAPNTGTFHADVTDWLNTFVGAGAVTPQPPAGLCQ